MHMWPPRYFLHMLESLQGVTVSQHQHTRVTFATNLKLVAPTGSSSTLIYLFIGDMLAIEILANKNSRCVNILPCMFYAKSIVSCRQRKEERRSPAREMLTQR